MLALSHPQDARAQQMRASLEHYSTEDGLPSNAISSIINDDYGYVWLTTWNGMVRFDGFNFYVYKTGIHSGIRGMHNRIANATIDQAQNVWMKMYDGRFFVINRQNDRIIDPFEGISGHDEFKADYFTNPYLASNGDIFIPFDNAILYCMRLDRNGLKQQQILTNGLTVRCLVGGYHNDVWAGTEKGVRRIDMSNLSLERKSYLTDEHITQLATNGYNIFVGTKSGKIYLFAYGSEPKLLKDIGKEVTGLFVDSHGLIWFSDLNDGAYYLHPETAAVKYFSQRVLSPEFTSRGAEFNEAMGVVWIRMNHGGYGYFNREADEVEYFHNDPSNPWNLSNTVGAELEMDDGVVWESTNRRGLEKLEIQKNTIRRKLLMPESNMPLDNEVRAMCYDKARHLAFICNKRGRIFVFDDDGNHVNTITHDSNGNPISRPYGMSVDSKGNYWVCDKDKGLFKITPSGGGNYTVLNICHDDKDIWSLSDNAAYQAVEDHDGNIWVATYGGGVNILRKNKAGKYIALHAKNALKRYPLHAYQKVRTIAVAKDGKVWAGTTDGILVMSLRNNNVTIEPLKEPENLEDGLMSTDIVNLACDPSGTMWVGTNSGGLSRTVKHDNNGAWIFKNYGVQDGLPSEEIRSITFDEKGNVWFSNEHILCSYNVSKNIFTTFSHLDGVDDTMTSEGSAMLAGKGLIIVGTLNGYYIVDRKKLTNSTGSLLKLRITDFYLNNVLQSPRLNSELDYYVPESKKVTIPKDYDEFSFRFAALNYQLQHRVVYQYMLEGYDEEWQNADKKRMATYNGVSAGTYKFHVKAFLLESPDAYDMRTIEVEVPSKFFTMTTLWICLIMIAIGLLAGYWWYKKRMKNDTTAKNDEHAETTEEADHAEDATTQDDDTEDIPFAEQMSDEDEYEIIGN